MQHFKCHDAARVWCSALTSRFAHTHASPACPGRSDCPKLRLGDAVSVLQVPTIIPRRRFIVGGGAGGGSGDNVGGVGVDGFVVVAFVVAFSVVVVFGCILSNSKPQR